MGNIWNKEKKTNTYIEQIKNIDTDNEELNNFLTVNNILIVRAMKEMITEIEEMKEKDEKRFHFQFPRALEICNMSIFKIYK